MSDESEVTDRKTVLQELVEEYVELDKDFRKLAHRMETFKNKFMSFLQSLRRK